MSTRKKIGVLAFGAIVLAGAAVAGDPGSTNPSAASAPTDTALATAATLIATPSAEPSAGPSDRVASPTPSVEPTATVAPTPTPLTGTVVEVIDGDTVHVALATGLEKVRIIGIDTPEVHHPSQPEACYGAEATVFATDMLDGETVILEVDPTQDERDRYDRLLAHVFIGDTLYTEAAISGGYGIHYVYERPSRHADELDAAAAAAKASGVGIWADCDGRVDLPLAAVVAPTPKTVVDAPEPTPADDACHPSYDPCVPNVGYDLDCKDVGFQVRVKGPDEYRLDGSDNDGRGCESY